MTEDIEIHEVKLPRNVLVHILDERVNEVINDLAKILFLDSLIHNGKPGIIDPEILIYIINKAIKEFSQRDDLDILFIFGKKENKKCNLISTMKDEREILKKLAFLHDKIYKNEMKKAEKELNDDAEILIKDDIKKYAEGSS